MGILKAVAGVLGVSGDSDREVPRPGRNEPCWCGSGKKYKKCHLEEDLKKKGACGAVKCGST